MAKGKPTIRQKLVFMKTLENGGNVSAAAREVGMSEATIHTPKNITESDGWKTLMETYLPDENLVKVHKAGLAATRGKKKEPDYFTRHMYLDTAYKIKHRYPTAHQFQQNNFNINLDPETQKKLELAKQKVKENLK